MSNTRKISLMPISPDQLILIDDPAFMAEMAIPALNFDISNLYLNKTILGDSQGSMLSPHSHSRRDSSASEGGSLLGLVIPTSDMGGSSYRLPFNDAFQLGDPSIQKISGGHRLFEDDEQGLVDNFGFEFDADGKIRDIDAAERDLLRSGSVLPRLSRLESDSAASGRVRREHEEGLADIVPGLAFDADDGLIMQMDDDHFILPDAQPFPLPGALHAQLESDAMATHPTETSSISAVVPLKKRKRKAPKTIAADQRIELSSGDLKAFHSDYLHNMDAAIRQKQAHRAPALARTNAYSWVFGNGLGGTGAGIGSFKIPCPLDVFSGDNLIATIMGVAAGSVSARSSKRSRGNGDDDDESEARRVRARQGGEEDQIGRGGEDDGFVPIFDESLGFEVGREAQSALEDHAASAMPWNISSSLHSYRNLTGPGSSSVQGPGTIGGRQSSILGAKHGARLASASPLIGRGTTNLEDLQRLDDVDLPAGDFDGLDTPGEKRSRPPLSATQEAEEFEIFGPTAAVDTQTAQDSYWIKEALARESLNFLEYVKNTLAEQEAVEMEDDAVIGVAENVKQRGVSFETLFPPESNSMMVAAQAFHHVLTLATKNLLSVKQVEPFDDIWMGIKEII